MNYYALIPLAGLFISIFVWAYIFAQPHKSPIRGAYLFFSGYICLWLAMNFILWLPLEGELLDRLMPFNAITWLPIGLFFYNFVLVFLSEKRGFFFYALMGLTALASILSLSTRLLVDGYHLLYWGPAHYPGPLYLPAVFLLITFPIVYGSFRVILRTRRIREPRVRRQHWLIIWGTATTLIFGIISELIPLYYEKGSNLIPLGSFSCVSLLIFIFFAVQRYRFLTFSMEDVAEELFARVQDGIVIIDKNQRLLRMNPAAKSLLQLPESASDERQISEFFVDYRFEDEYRGHITKLNPRIDAKIISITQSKLAYHGHNHGKILILRDVTEMVQLQEDLKKHSNHLEDLVKERTQEIQEAHQRLKSSEERYRVLIENNFGLVYEIEDGYFVDFCPHCSSILGYEPEELIGRHVFEFVSSDDCKALIHRYNLLKRGKSGRIMTYRFRHKDGQWRWIESIGKHYESLDGRARVLYIARDVTESKRLEEEMIKINKLQSVGVLAGGIAHDFNNILGTIWGRISLALTHLSPSDTAHIILSQTETGFNRAKDLTQQLLTFAKGGAPIKKTLSILDILQDAAMFALGGTHVRLEIAAAKEIWPVDVDEGQMNQVFSNLLINAEQAMPNGGVIEVDIGNVTLAEEPEAPLEPGKYVRIGIRDNGQGIPSEYISKIFDPYFTTKDKGNGLGLTTAYSIVQRHGGYIGVQSQPGLGSTFIVHLPASELPLIATNPPPEVELTGKGKILIMDDEVELCSLLEQALTEHGYEVVIVHNGAAAIDRVREALAEGVPFDLIIMDLVIPGGMGGKETIQTIRRWDPDVKAIVSSGYSEDTVMGEYWKYGFDGVLPKPFPVRELLSVVHRALEEDEALEDDGGISE